MNKTKIDYKFPIGNSRIPAESVYINRHKIILGRDNEIMEVD